MIYALGSKIVCSFLLVMFLGLNLFGKSDKVLLEAEHIKIASQGIAKSYFYIQQGLQSSSAKKGLKKYMIHVERHLKDLQKDVKDSGTKNIVEFMFFSTEELKSVLKSKYTTENGGLILDYTETLLEGAESIVNKNKADKETMLETVEQMSFLLARVTKYYIAFRSGYIDDINVKMAKKAVSDYEMLLKKVQSYKYPTNILNGPVKKLSKYWPVSKSFYLGIKKNELPTIVFISSKHMETALRKLSDYHNKSKK